MDEDEYDCETCERRLRLDALSSDDREALALYHAVAHPVVRDLGLVELAFEAFGLRCTREEVGDLMARLQVIHESVLRKQQPTEVPIDG